MIYLNTSIMNYIFSYILYICLFISSISISQQSSRLIAGPMFSYVDSYGTQIWFLLESGASKIDLDIKDYENNSLLEYTFEVVNKDDLKEFPFVISLEDLVPNMEYIVSVFIDDVFVKEMDLFTKRPHIDNLQFLLGSNLSSNPDVLSTEIFNHMQASKSDFMVWLGGHVAFSNFGSCVSPENLTFQGMFDSYVGARTSPVLNQFMSSTPQIATWGISDYATFPNSLRALKDSSQFVFDLFWPNSLRKTYNYTYFDYGVYQRYNYNDVDLFLLDSRTFISDSSLYGYTQIDRLFQEMQNTGSTFTIIASPVPFTFDTDDSFVNYEGEFNYFLEKIRVADIDGLLFVSTSNNNARDRSEKEYVAEESFTQMNTYSVSNNSSPVTSDELNEFNFTSFTSNTYSLINVSGRYGDRVLSFETYNQNGKIMYRKKLHQKDLKSN